MCLILLMVGLAELATEELLLLILLPAVDLCSDVLLTIFNACIINI